MVVEVMEKMVVVEVMKMMVEVMMVMVEVIKKTMMVVEVVIMLSAFMAAHLLYSRSTS